MDDWIIAVGVNAVVVAFGFGGAWFRLKANSDQIAAGQVNSQRRDKETANTKQKLWERFDHLNAREGRHYRNMLVVLTSISACIEKDRSHSMDLIHKMAEEDGEDKGG